MSQSGGGFGASTSRAFFSDLSSVLGGRTSVVERATAPLWSDADGSRQGHTLRPSKQKNRELPRLSAKFWLGQSMIPHFFSRLFMPTDIAPPARIIASTLGLSPALSLISCMMVGSSPYFH